MTTRPLPELKADELVRYARHFVLPEVGAEGQRRLKGSRVLIVGAGGLGSPVALYLAAAGVGTLGIVDFDTVDTSNLQRQILHGTRDVGRPKTVSARDRLRDVNPHVEVHLHETRLTSHNALEVVADYDVVVDGTDNFPTRYLVNDACVLTRRPNVYGSVFRFEGQASVFAMPGGPCYRCLHPEPPPAGLVPSCAEGGVLGVLPGIIGSIQATEAIKCLLGAPGTLVGRLLLFEAWSMRFQEFHLHRDPACKVCGDAPTVRALIDYEAFCGVRGRAGGHGHAVESASPRGTLTQEDVMTMEARELKRRMDAGEQVQLLDVREPAEFAVSRIPGSVHIPLAAVVARMAELDPERELIVHCKMGGRSARAIEALHAAGYRGRMINLTGGITAWAQQVDPGLRIG